MAPAGHGAWIELTEGYAKAVWVHFLDTARWDFLKNQPADVYPAQYVKGLGTVMELLLREQALNRPGCETVIHHYEEILTLYLLQETKDRGSPATRLAHQQLLHLRGQLIERLAEEWTVEKMAAVCHMSAGHLHLLTKRHESITPMELLRHLRMEHASTLLVGTTQTIDMIAQQVGYRTPYAFSDAFQRHTGKRPGAYRAGK